MLNNATLTGRLTRDIELRYTQSGNAVGTFTLAVDRQFRNAAGERDTDFINCQIWRKSAENLANFTRKGSLIGISGHIQTRTYDNKEGQRVYVTEVIVENFALLESKSQTAQGAPQPGQTAQPSNQDPAQPKPQPQATTAPKPDPFEDTGKSIDISDDDLPF